MYREQLDYFLLVYQLKSFAAAAAAIPMSPQGLSKAIKSLEAELGVDLFETDETGVKHPTDYGDAFYVYVQGERRQFSGFQSSVARLEARHKKEIRLGMSLGTMGLLGSDFLFNFSQRYPDISFRVDECPDHLCDKGLKNGLFDMAVTMAPYHNGFITVDLCSQPFYVWINIEDQLASKDSISLEDISEKNFAIPGRGFKCFDAIMRKSKSLGIRLDHIHTSSEIFWIHDFVSHGEGVGFTLPHLAKLESFKHNHHVIALPLIGFTWKFGISHNATSPLCEHEKLFQEYCVEVAEKTCTLLSEYEI